jgi:hypothetical protein
MELEPRLFSTTPIGTLPWTGRCLETGGGGEFLWPFSPLDKAKIG